MAELLPEGKLHPLLWNVPSAARPAWFKAAWLRTGSQVPAKRLQAGAEEFLNRTISAEPTLADSLEHLVWCHLLPVAAGGLAEQTWWSVLDQLLETANEAAGIPLAENPLVEQMLSGELSLTLAYLFPELAECRALADSARAALSRGPANLLDGEGAPAAKNLPLLRPLLATWTRSAYISRALGESCFSDTARAEYEWLVRHALRVTRFDGRQALAPEAGGDWQPELFAAALAFKNDWEDSQIAECALPNRKSKRTAAARRELPAPPTHSEWAESGVLRYDWHRNSDFLTITFHAQETRIELNCGPDTVFSGAWVPQVTADGKMLAPNGPWNVICWHVDDEDVIYLELELRFEEEWCIQRQLLLAGQDRFLLASDSVLGNRAAAIAYTSSLPLAPQTRFEHADDTREGLLVTGRRKRLVLPLALPEWQAERSTGSLVLGSEGLKISQTANGTGLFAPLFFDLDPRRVRLPRTWRRLTVAERLTPVPPDTAVGYRVQIGAKQWLVYRSFRQPSNRSVLGQNTSSECLVARFLRTGEVEELLEIE